MPRVKHIGASNDLLDALRKYVRYHELLMTLRGDASSSDQDLHHKATTAIEKATGQDWR